MFKAFWPWIYIIQFYVQLKSLIGQYLQGLELNYAFCMVFKAFWPWIPCLHRARSILELASVLRQGLSAAFRVICKILSRVSFWIYFRLVRVYLGDHRMRRVEDQDEEGKGPADQEDPGTRGSRSRGPRDQRTRGPEDQGPRDHRTRGPGDQRIRGTLNHASVNL